MNIYIGNLNYKVRENDLQQLLAEYGEITSVKVIMDRFRKNKMYYSRIVFFPSRPLKSKKNKYHRFIQWTTKI